MLLTGLLCGVDNRKYSDPCWAKPRYICKKLSSSSFSSTVKLRLQTAEIDLLKQLVRKFPHIFKCLDLEAIKSFVVLNAREA